MLNFKNEFLELDQHHLPYSKLFLVDDFLFGFILFIKIIMYNANYSPKQTHSLCWLAEHDRID